MKQKFARKILKNIGKRDRPSFVKRFNQINGIFRTYPFDVKLDPKQNTFILEDGSDQIHISRGRRAHYFLDGIRPRLDFLFSEYCGSCVQLNEGDLVIDCGANIGEFSLYCSLASAEVYSFEPDPVEFAALSANARHNMTPINKALWKENTRLQFFLENETGDSSIFAPPGAAETILVETTTLDDFCQTSLSGRKIRLLKLEAEGAEPEIMDGAKTVIKDVEYIAADLGPERGLEKESTLVPVSNFLFSEGFILEYFNPLRCTALFRNTQF